MCGHSCTCLPITRAQDSQFSPTIIDVKQHLLMCFKLLFFLIADKNYALCL